MKRYTHLWLHADGTCITEGTSHSNRHDAIAEIFDYACIFQRQDFYYHATYVEDLSTGHVTKIDLSSSKDFCGYQPGPSVQDQYPLPNDASL